MPLDAMKFLNSTGKSFLTRELHTVRVHIGKAGEMAYRTVFKPRLPKNGKLSGLGKLLR